MYVHCAIALRIIMVSYFSLSLMYVCMYIYIYENISCYGTTTTTTTTTAAAAVSLLSLLTAMMACGLLSQNPDGLVLVQTFVGLRIAYVQVVVE